MYKEIILANIKKAQKWRPRRVRAKMKLGHFATKAKVRKSDLSRWERGIVIPRPANVKKVESALKKLGV